MSPKYQISAINVFPLLSRLDNLGFCINFFVVVYYVINIIYVVHLFCV